MSDISPPDLWQQDAQENPSGEADALTDLRDLLLGNKLNRLQESMEDPKRFAEEVSHTLPQAIVFRTSRDRKLVVALEPTVEEIILASVRKDPAVLANALFPVIIPAIRKMIAESFRQMVRSFNQALDRSLSPRGLKWRLEALRTGKPFAEVVLLHCLIYRIEQIFLIHRETGLLLQHTAIETGTAQNADLISGMLTAIQDFVRDSFRIGQDETLETIEVGDLSVWIEQGSGLILAGVIRGSAPETVRDMFKETLSNICLEKSREIDGFQGDTAPFETIRPHMDACLETEVRPPGRRPPFFWIFIVLLLAVMGVWGFFSLRNHLQWTDYLARLKAEPGIVVTDAERDRDRYVVTGLRDPLARSPLTILKETSLDPARLVSHWEPYQAQTPQFVLIRVRALLAPPDTVSLALRDGVLTARGTAPHSWVTESRLLARTLPGITEFEDEGLTDAEMRTIRTLKQEIEKQRIYYDEGAVQPRAGQEETLRDLAENALQLQELAARCDRRIDIRAEGHADATGTEDLNLHLSQQRADRIRSFLTGQGLLPTRIRAVGMGTQFPLAEGSDEEASEKNRRTGFHITVTD